MAEGPPRRTPYRRLLAAGTKRINGTITATMPGSGKTILTSGPRLLYGERVFSWTDSDEELRKTITSALATAEGVMILTTSPRAP